MEDHLQSLSENEKEILVAGSLRESMVSWQQSILAPVTVPIRIILDW